MNQITRETLAVWLAELRRAWIFADLAAVEKIFKKTAAYYETPLVEPVSGAGILALWREVKQGDLDYLEYEILAIEGAAATVNERFSWRGQKRDGVYLLKFDDAGDCVFFKRWKITEGSK